MCCKIGLYFKDTRGGKFKTDYLTFPHKNCKHLTFSLENRKNIKLLSMVKILLLRAGVESNPGPETFSIESYNVRGIGDKKKRDVLFNYLNKTSGKNTKCLIMLQEIHVKQEVTEFLKLKWRPDKIFRGGNGSSGGVAVLAGADFQVKDLADVEEHDDRLIVALLEDVTCPDLKFIVCNIYAPNERDESTFKFYEKVFNTIHNFRNKHNVLKLIMGGDLNCPLFEDECIHRTFTPWERRLAQFILNGVELLDLVDCKKTAKRFEGTSHTFQRLGTRTFSTIDRIFVSRILSPVNKYKS
jgi:exonuclease III